MGALFLGLLAGVVCFTSTYTLKQILKVDDSLDVFPVHGVGGILGSLMTACLAHEAAGASGRADRLGSIWRADGGSVVRLLGTFVILKLLDFSLGLRVSREEEIEGLDISQHEERGYHL